MKKVISLLLAVVMIFTLGAAAFAAPAAEKGSITITNAVEGKTYDAYKLFDFKPVKGDAKKGLYTVDEAFASFVSGDGAAYVKVENGTVVWVGDQTAERIGEFAKLAVKFAKTNDIPAAKSATADSAAVTLGDLDLGYYAVNSSLGSVCAVVNTNSDLTLIEKNGQPTIDKVVLEDSTSAWGKENSAEMGTVKYKTTVTAQLGAQNYVIHDKMEKGLTFNPDSLKVTLDYADETEDKVLTATTDYDVTAPANDGCTFDVDFTEALENTLKSEDKLIVEYTATLNKDAEIHPETNDNETWLTYGASEHSM